MGTRRDISRFVADGVLGRVTVGDLVVQWPDGSEAEFGGVRPGPSAHLNIKDARAVSRAILGGSVGFAEGYLDGLWDTPDLSAMLDLAYTNISQTRRHTSLSPGTVAGRVLHALHANSLRGSPKNISYHYDLGNEFFELWLDDTMTYSCALFADQDENDLSGAQRSKWDRLLELLQPSARDHLLEIGCGWGGFALHAAKEAGCRVTGITLSQEQHDYATRRVAEEGLDGRVEIRLQDYRHVGEVYSGVASIEMFEAVGERYWPTFFKTMSQLLETGGRAAIQTITICEESFERYRANPDFIQRFIFPGGMLPSPERFALAAAEQGLSVGEPHFFGASYARTLEIWLERFDDACDAVIAMGFNERFIRAWRYYLAYCRTGFRSGNVNVMQVTLDN